MAITKCIETARNKRLICGRHATHDFAYKKRVSLSIRICGKVQFFSGKVGGAKSSGFLGASKWGTCNLVGIFWKGGEAKGDGLSEYKVS